jgi:hypothetical protein
MDKPNKDAIEKEVDDASRRTEQAKRLLERARNSELADRTGEHDPGSPDRWNEER